MVLDFIVEKLAPEFYNPGMAMGDTGSETIIGGGCRLHLCSIFSSVFHQLMQIKKTNPFPRFLQRRDYYRIFVLMRSHLQQIRIYRGPNNVGTYSGQCLHNSANDANQKRSLIFRLKRDIGLCKFFRFITSIAANMMESGEKRGNCSKRGATPHPQFFCGVK